MRKFMIVLLACGSIAATAVAAQSEWHSYVSHELGLTFKAPGEVKSSIGTFQGDLAGRRQTTVFRSVDNNIEYRATVMKFTQAQPDGGDLVGEIAFMFEKNRNGTDVAGQKVLMDTLARVDVGKDVVYGRKITVDLPKNGGRRTAAFYFNKGKLYEVEATVLPARGDYNTPDVGRFIDSISFDLSRADKSSTELKLPPPD
jgi:hypothetical protein